MTITAMCSTVHQTILFACLIPRMVAKTARAAWRERRKRQRSPHRSKLSPKDHYFILCYFKLIYYKRIAASDIGSADE